jgi:hypothetical protein
MTKEHFHDANCSIHFMNSLVRDVARQASKTHKLGKQTQGVSAKQNQTTTISSSLPEYFRDCSSLHSQFKNEKKRKAFAHEFK